MPKRLAPLLLTLSMTTWTPTAASPPESAPAVPLSSTEPLAGRFQWTAGPPLVGPSTRPEDPCQSIKDPTIVRYQDRWHLFCTIRSRKRTHQIEYLAFGDFKDADKASRHVLRVSDGYYCAPQVFYFTPLKQWFLIYQAVIDRDKGMVPVYSTSADLSDPEAWSKPVAFIDRKPDNIKAWIDFWVICDRQRAHLFFTSQDGGMWRAETRLADFPRGWGRPEHVLQDDIFEASHTYKLKDMDRYLTIVEAQGGSRRYFKAYLADTLDGKWRPLAATREQPFASSANVKETAEHWTDSVSHGELLRTGYDQNLEVDPAHLRFLFQGVRDQDMAGKTYGQIPWRLGLLEPGP